MCSDPDAVELRIAASMRALHGECTFRFRHAPIVAPTRKLMCMMLRIRDDKDSGEAIAGTPRASQRRAVHQGHAAGAGSGAVYGGAGVRAGYAHRTHQGRKSPEGAQGWIKSGRGGLDVSRARRMRWGNKLEHKIGGMIPMSWSKLLLDRCPWSWIASSEGVDRFLSPIAVVGGEESHTCDCVTSTHLLNVDFILILHPITLKAHFELVEYLKFPFRAHW
ncbi:hypothetical protein FB451DRAFT_1507597 [Mycena latifolia]|nr:hypothetical protein FB451DRAFT_1507597 [Mycena latifolia]